jgi:hypothetical protein
MTALMIILAMSFGLIVPKMIIDYFGDRGSHRRGDGRQRTAGASSLKKKPGVKRSNNRHEDAPRRRPDFFANRNCRWQRLKYFVKFGGTLRLRHGLVFEEKAT